MFGHGHKAGPLLLDDAPKVPGVLTVIQHPYGGAFHIVVTAAQERPGEVVVPIEAPLTFGMTHVPNGLGNGPRDGGISGVKVRDEFCSHRGPANHPDAAGSEGEIPNRTSLLAVSPGMPRLVNGSHHLPLNACHGQS